MTEGPKKERSERTLEIANRMSNSKNPLGYKPMEGLANKRSTGNTSPKGPLCRVA